MLESRLGPGEQRPTTVLFGGKGVRCRGGKCPNSFSAAHSTGDGRRKINMDEQIKRYGNATTWGTPIGRPPDADYIFFAAGSRESLPVVSWRRRCALHFGKKQKLRPVGDDTPIDDNFPDVRTAFINGRTSG